MSRKQCPTRECPVCCVPVGQDFNFCSCCGTRIGPPQSPRKTTTGTIQGKKVSVKVDILLGLSATTISQKEGGGKRCVELDEDDNLDTIKQRIVDIYFPGKRSTYLGKPEDYHMVVLDFKRDAVERRHFTGIRDYQKKNGLLSLVTQPAFFIQLHKQMRPFLDDDDENTEIPSQRSSNPLATQTQTKTPTTQSTISVPKTTLSTVSTSPSSTTPRLYSQAPSDARTSRLPLTRSNVAIMSQSNQTTRRKRSPSSSSSSASSCSSNEYREAKKINADFNRHLAVSIKQQQQQPHKTITSSTTPHATPQQPKTKEIRPPSVLRNEAPSTGLRKPPNIVVPAPVSLRPPPPLLPVPRQAAPTGSPSNQIVTIKQEKLERPPLLSQPPLRLLSLPITSPPSSTRVQHQEAFLKNPPPPSPKSPHQPALCYFFWKRTCKKGDRCEFSHDVKGKRTICVKM